MRCPKCTSSRTFVEFPPDEYFCASCLNTFYDQKRVIRDRKPIQGAVDGRVGHKERPFVSGMYEVYRKGGLV